MKQDCKKEYIDVRDIESKSDLFLRIYKAAYANKLYGFVKPQQLADEVLEDCKNGLGYAQFLIEPENPILTVCRMEKISRSGLAKLLGIRVSRLENCLSRKRCSKSVLKMLAERFNYIKGE